MKNFVLIAFSFLLSGCGYSLLLHYDGTSEKVPYHEPFGIAIQYNTPLDERPGEERNGGSSIITADKYFPAPVANIVLNSAVKDLEKSGVFFGRPGGQAKKTLRLDLKLDSFKTTRVTNSDYWTYYGIGGFLAVFSSVVAVAAEEEGTKTGAGVTGVLGWVIMIMGDKLGTSTSRSQLTYTLSFIDVSNNNTVFSKQYSGWSEARTQGRDEVAAFQHTAPAAIARANSVMVKDVYHFFEEYAGTAIQGEPPAKPVTSLPEGVSGSKPIVMISPVKMSIATSPTVTITFVVTLPEELVSILVLNNDKVSKLPTPLIEEARKSGGTVSVEVQLERGRNLIQVIGIDKKGNKYTEEIEIQRTK